MMTDEAPTIWLTGLLEQAPTTIMKDGESTVQLDILATGPAGPVEILVEAPGQAHADLIASRRPGKGERIVIHGTINDETDDRPDVTADLIALAVSDERARP